VQLAAGYLASAVSPGAKALVIATDVALTDARAQYAEPATGTGAAAMLVSDDPRVLTIDLGAFGNYSYETMDSARPSPEFDIADVDTSLFAYLDCLAGSVDDYLSRVAGADLAAGFDYLAMHTPFCGLVKAAHRKLMRRDAALSEAELELDFARRVAPSLHYPRVVGNLCSGSLYLALASLIEQAPITGPARVGLYSYGSGCSSEFFSGVVDAGSAAALAGLRIGKHLASRSEISFADYEELAAQTQLCLVPREHRDVDPARYADLTKQARVQLDRPLLVFRGIAAYHRKYDWM
jgi:polyketide biosynthesis 3-hydroxy-3-methylglutaryl-CoA synthase-like enzyme PksG